MDTISNDGIKVAARHTVGEESVAWPPVPCRRNAMLGLEYLRLVQFFQHEGF